MGGDSETMVTGSAEGELVWTDVPLSFWGGVDPESGVVIDAYHPLRGASIAGKLLAMPRSRGSCSGSGVMMQLLLNGKAPSGLIFREPDEILPLGIIVAKRMFGISIPALCLDGPRFEGLAGARIAAIRQGRLVSDQVEGAKAARDPGESVALTAADRGMLAGRQGRARQVALEIVVEAAAMLGAGELMDVTRAHIDGCIYTGEAGLRFARLLGEWGGAVAVPTTLNAISVDQRRWRSLGVPEALGQPAAALADAYVALGCRPSFTCAPYLLADGPDFGEQIAWAESNAVVFANSAIGARTLKYPDYLDICVALTGRAPRSGCHLDAARRATLTIEVGDAVSGPPDDDALYPLLGYLTGECSGHEVPILLGLEDSAPTRDDLKALCAAFATTSSAPMLHVRGVTPEATGDHLPAPDALPAKTMAITRQDVLALRRRFNARATGDRVDLVAIGNPHCSVEEIARIARLFGDRHCAAGVAFVVTCGKEVYDEAAAAGLVAALAKNGAGFLNDTCWCMIEEPVIPADARRILTNSAKYAHYGPGLTRRELLFGSLAECVEAACTGRFGGG